MLGGIWLPVAGMRRVVPRGAESRVTPWAALVSREDPQPARRLRATVSIAAAAAGRGERLTIRE